MKILDIVVECFNVFSEVCSLFGKYLSFGRNALRCLGHFVDGGIDL